MLIEQRFPSLLVCLFRILVYKMRAGMRRTFCMLFIRLDCLFPCGFPQRSPVLQVAVIPFEIDVSRHVNLDNRAFPRFFPRMVIPNVVFEQLAASSPTVAATIGRDLLGHHEGFWFADLPRIDNLAHPYFV